MKQILQNLKTGQIEVSDIPVPSVKHGHLLIKTRKTLISTGTERMLLEFGKAGWINKARQQPDKVKQVVQKIKTDGFKPTVDAVFNKLNQPVSLGYSNVGVVIDIGSGVDGFKIGDRVVSNGHHAEVVCVPKNLCEKIPEEVNDSAAAFVVLSAVALQGIRLINPTIGESVAVMGLGTIGLLACQILRANGCRVLGIDFEKEKLELANKYGVEICDLSEGVDPVSEALSFSDGYGVDAVLITASTKSNDPIKQSPAMCRKKGRIVLVGVVGLEISRDDFYKKEISFQVSCSYGPGRYEREYEDKGLDYPIEYIRWTEKRNLQAVLQLMAEGRIKTDDLISSTYPILDAIRAYDEIESKKKVMGIILDYDGLVDTGEKRIEISESKSPKSDYNKAVIGFIGAGSFASSTLIPAFKKNNVRLKTIASSSGVTSSQLGKRYDFEINTTDYHHVLEDNEINVVVITTQHNSHARLVIEALEAGKNVFVEKPLCLREDELYKITSAYNSRLKTLNSQLNLMVGFNRRFAPLTLKLKELIAPLSAPKSFIMTVNAGSIPSDHWVQDTDIGGGRIIGEVCHFIDLLKFLNESEITKYELFRVIDISNDSVSISLSFNDGSIGTIHYLANGNKDFPKERLEVFCGGKILQLNNFKSLTGFGFTGFSKMRLWSQDKGHQKEVSEFLNAIVNGRPSPIPFKEILEVSKVTIDLNNKANNA